MRVVLTKSEVELKLGTVFEESVCAAQVRAMEAQ
jgi:hypothetical protein